MEYDVLAFIGRFQPFHNGHKTVIEKALTLSKKVAIVLGSHDQPRSARNPFTTFERIQMITSVFSKEVSEGRIHFVPQVDHTYNISRWIAEITTGVMVVANTPFTPDPVKIGLIGHSKDDSSFYLKSFPTWGSVEVANFENLNATDIRAKMFFDKRLFSELPLPVHEFILDWCQGKAFQDVKAEHDFVEKYKRQWSTAPYPPVFYTADAVVVQSGHILLVKRGAMPGEGLWALPGGFVNRFETSREAAIRELKEETRIDLPEKALEGSIRSQRLFEDPYRSQRGRTITVAYIFELRSETSLPKIKAADDAAAVQWVPLSNLIRSAMFEDHYDIISTMVSI